MSRSEEENFAMREHGPVDSVSGERIETRRVGLHFGRCGSCLLSIQNRRS